MVTEVLTIKFSELMPRYSFRRLPFAATALRGLKAMTVSFFVLFFSDLKLGDAHLVPVDDRESRKDGQDYVRFTSQLFASYRNFRIRVKQSISDCHV